MTKDRPKNRLLSVAAALMAMTPALAAASDGSPIISFHTSAYDPEGEKLLSFALMSNKPTTVDVDFGNGIKTYDVKAGMDQSQVTWIQEVIPADGNIKVYGDSEAIDYVDLEGAYITDLDISSLTNVYVLILAHNELKEIDLSPFQSLSYLDLMDNQLENLVLDRRLDSLLLLDISYAGHLDPSFTLANYPNLQQFVAQNCDGLTQIDPSSCPALLRLTVDGTDISSLDVSGNRNLRILNISETKVTDIDITKNNGLTEFYCNHEGSKNSEYKISSLDLSGNPLLKRFFCTGNNLTELDVTKNPDLTDLYAGNNYLTQIDLSNNLMLDNVSIRKNFFTFATMPDFSEDKVNLEWLPMRPMQVDPSYPEGASINLADKVLREGGDTFAMAFSDNASDPSSPVELEEGIDFTYADGVVTMLTAQADSCHVEFYNTLFPDGIISTSSFMVRPESEYGKPTRTITLTTTCETGTPLASHVSVDVRNSSQQNPVTVFVDYGNGELKPLVVEGPTPLDGNTAGSLIGLYVPDGHFFSGLSVTDIPLAAADVTMARKLRTLTVRNTGIYEIDLSWNSELESIDVSGNNLTSLDLSGDNKAVVKNVLQRIDASQNEISSFTLENRDVPVYINLSHNRISDYDFAKLKAVTTLDLSYNSLSELSIEGCEFLSDLNLAGNNLNSISIPEEALAGMTRLLLNDNCLDFSTLPLKTSTMTEYVYAPQKKIAIAERSYLVNLADKLPLITDPASGETFPSSVEWRDADGKVLAEGSDYSFADGVTTFSSSLTGKNVYGVLSNSIFPELSGDNALQTSETLVSGKPDKVLASFTTTQGGEKVSLSLASTEPDTYIFIDWKGDGSLTEYPLQTEYTLFEAETTKDAEVKVYGYPGENPIKVFSINGASMKNIDVNDLTNAVNITLANAGLEEISLPESGNLRELALTGNRLSSIDLSKLPNLYSLVLMRNDLENVDLSHNPAIEWLSLTANRLSTLDVTGLESLYWLDANENDLSEIDLSGNPRLGVLNIEDNNFSTLDIESNRELMQVIVSRNFFTLSTLPVPRVEWGTYYTYAPQADVKVELEDGIVDLSSEAEVDDEPTTFLWYFGRPEINSETGELTGDQLVEGTDYTEKDGVTTFLRSQSKEVTGVMLNPLFPYLLLCTEPIKVELSAISDVESDIFLTVEGNRVRVAGQARIYSIDGIPVETEYHDGMTVAENLTGGVYVIKAGDKTAKAIIR